MPRTYLLTLALSFVLLLNTTTEQFADTRPPFWTKKNTLNTTIGSRSAQQGESYRVAEGDMVQVIVYNEDELSSSMRIGKDGTVVFPGIGTINIGGQTVREAAKTVEARLSEILVKPHVTVTVVGYSKQRFTIFGEVAKPGTYEFSSDVSLDLLSAIAMAGGYSLYANPSRITLKRVVDGQETVIRLDGKRMMSSRATKRFEVLSGDTIMVEAKREERRRIIED